MVTAAAGNNMMDDSSKYSMVNDNRRHSGWFVTVEKDVMDDRQ